MLVGLTGNIGTGKSTVLGFFSKLGALTIDSDEVVGALYTRDDIKAKVIAILGNEIIDDDGHLNKNKIANIIFNNKELKRKLEALLHNFVFIEIETLHHKNPDRVVVAEIPLLFETGYNKKMDKVIMTSCQTETIYKRLMNGYTKEEVESRLANQSRSSDRETSADYLINTDRTMADIEEEVKIIYNALTKMSS
jgi:dephospho-CoA kinase